MLPLILGLLVFVAIHAVPMQPDVRNGLVSRYGETAYKAVFSLIALGGFALIVIGYHKLQLHPGKSPQLWTPPSWGRHVTFLLMLPVFPLLIAAYLPGRIKTALRHPMLAAVKLWALAHLFVRGDAGSLLLFAGLLAWAAVDRISVKKRDAGGSLARPAGPVRNDIIAVVAGLVIYAVFVRWGHPALIGIPLIHG